MAALMLVVRAIGVSAGVWEVAQALNMATQTTPGQMEWTFIVLSSD